MAGLESIALAVAHLERAEKESERGDDVLDSPSLLRAKSEPPIGVPFERTPRLVSTELGTKAVVLDAGSRSREGWEGSISPERLRTIHSSSPTIQTSERTTQSAFLPGSVASLAKTTTNNTEYGRAMVINNSFPLNQSHPATFREHGTTVNSARFLNQISTKILLKCKQEDGASDDPVASLLAKIASVTDDLPLLFQLMDELCEHGIQEYGPPVPVPPADQEISEVKRNDVLSGRGGETNHHYGNVQYRRIVKACQPAYLVAKRRDKPNVAAAIVKVIRARSGRFLKKKNVKSASWYDVGNTKAREKSSQALREGAPELRNFVQPEKSPAQGDTGTVHVLPSENHQIVGGHKFSQPSADLDSARLQSPQFVSHSLLQRLSATTSSSPTPASSHATSDQPDKQNTKPAQEATVVGRAGEIKQSALVRAMKHYKNLYGKEKDTEPPKSGEKRKVEEVIESDSPRSGMPSIVETLRPESPALSMDSKQSASSAGPPTKRFKQRKEENS